MSMFCYQCEQTDSGTGCVEFGVCGKEADVAVLQDLLVYQLEGIALYASPLLNQGNTLPSETHRFVLDALFSTLTNVNFDQAFFIDFLRQSQAVKSNLQSLVKITSPAPAALYTLPEAEDAMLVSARTIILRPQAQSDPDVQSLKDTLLYGLKGMAAYAHHAWVLGYQDEEVISWCYKGLAAMTDMTLDLNALVG